MYFEHRMLIVSSGQRADRSFRNVPGFDIQFINVGALRYHNLWGYTAVFIGSCTDEPTLAQCTRKLSDFVNKGGILVCLGCQGQESQWIPFCHWSKPEPRTASWHNTSDDYNIIFKGINPDLLKFHDFYGHGTLEPPSNAKVLARGDGEAMFCLVDEGTRGAALITTLDPDFHSQPGITTMDKEHESEKKAEAKRLIENIFGWCVWKFNQKNSRRSFFWRRIRGAINKRFLYFLFFLVPWPLSINIAIIYFVKGKYDLWIAIPGLASVIGLAIMITDKFLEIRRQ